MYENRGGGNLISRTLCVLNNIKTRLLDMLFNLALASKSSCAEETSRVQLKGPSSGVTTALLATILFINVNYNIHPDMGD